MEARSATSMRRLCSGDTLTLVFVALFWIAVVCVKVRLLRGLLRRIS